MVGMPLVASPREDARTYAKDFGVSVEEADRRLGLQGAIGELDAALTAEESATFAGLWIEHKPQYRVVVRFTDDAAKARLAKRIAGGPLEGLVVTRSARIPLAELEKQQKALRAAGNKVGAEFSSDIEVQSNRINVYSTQPEKLRASLGKALPESVNIERVERGPQTQAIRGGDALTSCTAGFTVRHNSTGELGVLTAGHCSDYQSFLGATPLPYRSGKTSQYTDAQWHSTCDIVETVNQVNAPDGPRTISATRSRTYQ
ncbi:MAG TPA: hypothetical protein VF111_04505, partial [Thermoanaerobaculia bacterium]